MADNISTIEHCGIVIVVMEKQKSVLRIVAQ